jgi:hypothetical protein
MTADELTSVFSGVQDSYKKNHEKDECIFHFFCRAFGITLANTSVLTQLKTEVAAILQNPTKLSKDEQHNLFEVGRFIDNFTALWAYMQETNDASVVFSVNHAKDFNQLVDIVNDFFSKSIKDNVRTIDNSLLESIGFTDNVLSELPGAYYDKNNHLVLVEGKYPEHSTKETGVLATESVASLISYVIKEHGIVKAREAASQLVSKTSHFTESKFTSERICGAIAKHIKSEAVKYPVVLIFNDKAQSNGNSIVISFDGKKHTISKKNGKFSFSLKDTATQKPITAYVV